MRTTLLGALSLLPGLALAAPLDPASQESLDKRLFLLRRAAERGDCVQAVEAADMIEKDFGDVPGARVGKAYALACSGRWVDAWGALAAARAAGADVREVEALVRANLAFAEVRVLVDGAPSDKPEFGPAVMVNGGLVPLRQVKGAVYALEGMPAGTVSIVANAGGGDYIAAPVVLDLTAGRTGKADLVWKASPIGALQLTVTVNGGAMSADDALTLPAPEVTTATGARVKLEADGVGRWKAPRAPAGPLRIRLPASTDNDETTGAVEVLTRQTATASLDVKRQATAMLARPAGLDPSITLSVGGKELGPDATRVRAGTVDVTARWTGGTAAPITYADDLTDGVGLPWVHVVKDERGAVLAAGMHGPDEREVVLDGVGVRSDRVANTTWSLRGTLAAAPGGVREGTVVIAGNAVSAERGKRGMILAAGGVATLAAGGWMLAEIGQVSRQSETASTTEDASVFATSSAAARSAATRGNIALGTTIAAALGTVGGVSFTFAMSGDRNAARTLTVTPAAQPVPGAAER